MATDVTEIRESSRRQRLMINELNHRVKNTLATVQSLVRQTLRERSIDTEVEQLVCERMIALAGAHDVLVRENWDDVELKDLADEAARPYNESGRITFCGPRARLSPKSAIALSMALHELITNAIKHGSLSNPDGRADLSWLRSGSTILLEWRESGGPLVGPPKRSGFGSRLLGKVMAGELGRPAELTFAPDGLICRLHVPAERTEVAPES